MFRAHLCFLLVVTAGCSEPDPGTSSGRPPADPVVRPEVSPLRIAEVYVADADTSEHFVELMVDDTESLSLAGAELCGPMACVEVAGSVAPGERAVRDIGDLDLPASAGELAVVQDGVVLAYLAWGTEPTVFGSPWPAAAVLSEATLPGAFVRLPFPMPFGVAVVNEADGVQGCALPSSGVAGTLDPATCPDAPPPLFLSEIFTPADDEAPSWVEIENTASSSIRLAGARLCQLPSCIAFGYGDTIGAQSRVLVHLGRSGGAADPAQLFFPDAPPVRAGGELVLLAPGSGDVAEDASLLSFVRYGAALTGEASAAAVRAGLWPEIFDAARAPRVVGESLSRDLSGELSGSAWNPTTPSPVAENPDISEATDLWQSCSFPRPWNTAPASDILVTQVIREDAALVRVSNRGDVPVDVSSYSVALAAVAHVINDATTTGAATDITDEAVARVPNGADTNIHIDDFARAEASPGSSNGGVEVCAGLLINEIVTDPLQDWDDSTAAADPVPFDLTPGPGAAGLEDQWIEIFNCGAEPVDLSGYTLELTDATPSLIELGVTEGPTLPGDLIIAAGGYLVVGNPDPVDGLDHEIEVVFKDTSGAIMDRVLVGVTSLTPGRTTTIELRIDQEDCDPLHVCWRGAPQLPANGELTLFDGGDILQHLRWGDAASTYTDDAVTAGVWPLSECALPELAEGGVIELSSIENGQSPPDYR